MKRLKVELSAITDWHNLAAAAHRAARGKRQRTDVRAFFADFEQSLEAVQRALSEGRLPDGSYRRFSIRDPKPRVIHAAPFPDRVAHHALMSPMAEHLNDWQVATSFACREAKGAHAAVQYAQRQMRRYGVYLKMDVIAYFDAIDHRKLMSLLCQRLKGKDIFPLIDAVLATYSTTMGKGLPIGALTSQHFANVYLTPADRRLLSQPSVRAHCRYMDDTVVWCNTVAEASDLFREYAQWLETNWALKLKPPVIQSSRQGLVFCGYRIKPHSIRPGRRRLRRFNRLLRHWHKAFDAYEIDEKQLQQRVDSLLAMLQPAETHRWRKKRFETVNWPDEFREMSLQ